METEKKKSGCTRIFLIFCFSFLAIVGIICIFNDNNESQETEVINKKVNTNKKIQIVYDIPSLFGLNIDQIRKKLGKPEDIRYKDSPNVSEIDPPANELNTTDEWSNTYHKDNLSIDISFNPKTRKVNDFFIGYNYKSFCMEDFENPTDSCVFLMESFNVKKDANEYIIKSAPLASNHNICNGLTITPISNVQK